MRTYLGIDIGGTNLRLIAQSHQQHRTHIASTPIPQSLPDLLDTIAQLAHELAPGADVAHAGVGLPGRTRTDTPQWIPNVPYLDGVPLARLIGERLGCPVTLANDGQVTMLAEWREGAARNARHALLVTIGTGIGGAVILDGSLMRGATGTLGSVGWLPAPLAERRADQGPWETAASGTALARLAAAHGSVPALLDAARAGEVKAVEIVAGYGRTLGVGIAALAAIFDPEIIVLAGGVSRAFDLLAPILAETMATESSPTGQHVPIALAQCADDAGVIGALHLALTPEVIR